MHVRSLVRLFIGAALLCLAWVVLTSGQASAAERPATSQPRSDLGRTLPLVDRDGLASVLGSVLGKPSAPVDRPADHPAKAHNDGAQPKAGATSKAKASGEKRSPTRPSATKTSATKPVREVGAADQAMAPVAALSDSVDEALRAAPVLDVVGSTARSTVDTGLALVTDVGEIAGSAPVVGEPLGRVTDAVVDLVQSLPPVVVPSPIVPLPIGDGTPTPVVPLPGVTEAVATERDPATARTDLRPGVSRDLHPFLTRGGFTPATDGAPVQTREPVGLGGRGAPSGPWAPLDSSPALPSQPSPGGGAAQGAGDPATASPSVALPNPSLFGRSSADWRVPRGLPAHPGTRPD